MSDFVCLLDLVGDKRTPTLGAMRNVFDLGAAARMELPNARSRSPRLRIELYGNRHEAKQNRSRADCVHGVPLGAKNKLPLWPVTTGLPPSLGSPHTNSINPLYS